MAGLRSLQFRRKDRVLEGGEGGGVDILDCREIGMSIKLSLNERARLIERGFPPRKHCSTIIRVRESIEMGLNKTQRHVPYCHTNEETSMDDKPARPPPPIMTSLTILWCRRSCMHPLCDMYGLRYLLYRHGVFTPNTGIYLKTRNYAKAASIFNTQDSSAFRIASPYMT